MLTIKILVIGKPKKSYLAEGISDYFNRLKQFARIEIKDIREPKKSTKQSEQEIVHLEAKKFRDNLDDNDYVIALDRKGKVVSSTGFANVLASCMKRNVNPVTFLIGGELGLADELIQRADLVISLSKLTFTHDMTRLILLEQLYRGFTILAGKKYHK